MLSGARLFFLLFLSCDGGAIFTSESGALLAYLQMQIGVTLYLQQAFFSVHKRRNTILKNKTRIWHPQSTCVLSWIIYFLMLIKTMLSCGAGNVQVKLSNIWHGLNLLESCGGTTFISMSCKLPRCACLGTNAKLHLSLQAPSDVLPLGWLSVATEMVKVDWIKLPWLPCIAL